MARPGNGYTEFVAQGGDWGNAVTGQMALSKPPGLLGIHTNMPAAVPPDVSRALAIGDPPPAGLSADEKRAYETLAHFFATGVGYANEVANRPQTLYGVADSPIGLAPWMLDHDVRSYELIARAFTGTPGGLSRDDVLDNVTYPKLIHFNKVDEGGHFAAWEQPKIFSEEIRATFRPLR